MPDVSNLISQETVTLPTPTEQAGEINVTLESADYSKVIPASYPQEVKIDVENNVNTIEKKPQIVMCPVHGENKIEGCPDHRPYQATETITDENGKQIIVQSDDYSKVIEKIECDRCHKILNGKEELPAHNLEFHNGRPCKFCENKESIMKTVNEYFKKCYDSKPQQIPFIEEVALILDVDEDTIGNWAHKKIGETDTPEHPEFFGVYTKLKVMQKLFLSKRILGRYNPTGAIGLLKWHHGMMETSKQILAGSKDQGEEITLRIVEDKPTIINE